MKIIKNNNGYALYVTILLIFFIATVGISLLTLTANANKTTLNERSDQSFFYFAEAGINLEKSNLTKVFKNLDQKIKTHFNSLDFEKQTKLLSQNNNSFTSYYYSQMNASFCSEFNALFKPDTQPNKCQTNKYSSSFELTSQYDKQPIVNTSVLLNCTSECTVALTAKGYFKDNPAKYRIVTQELKISANPYISNGSSGEGSENGGSGSGDKGNSAQPLENYSAITNGNISVLAGAIINGNTASLKGTITLDGGGKIEGSIAALSQSKLIYPSYMTEVSKQYTTLPNIPSGNTTNPLQQYLPVFPDSQVTYGKTIAVPKNLEVVKDSSNKTLLINTGGLYSNTWMTQNYTLPLTQDTRFTTFNIEQNNTLTLDIGNRNINLFIDDLNIPQGHLKISGTGTLNIYVNKMTQVKGSINDKGNPNSLNIYHYGSAQNGVNFSNETQLYGSFYTKNSNVKFTNSAGLYGNFYSGGSKVEISGGVQSAGQWLVAPNADLLLYGGGEIIGTVLANTIYMDGGTEINYGEPVVPNPATPAPPTNPYTASTASDIVIEGPILESDK